MENQAARQTPLTALAALACLAVVLALAVATVLAPWLPRIGLAIAFVLTLRFIGAREGLAEWTFLRLPVLLICSAVIAAISYVAIYGLN